MQENTIYIFCPNLFFVSLLFLSLLTMIAKNLGDDLFKAILLQEYYFLWYLFILDYINKHDRKGSSVLAFIPLGEEKQNLKILEKRLPTCLKSINFSEFSSKEEKNDLAFRNEICKINLEKVFLSQPYVKTRRTFTL